jgi:hypothetical protein
MEGHTVQAECDPKLTPSPELFLHPSLFPHPVITVTKSYKVHLDFLTSHSHFAFDILTNANTCAVQDT